MEGEPGYSRTTSFIGPMNGLSSVDSVFRAGITSWPGDWAGRKRDIQTGGLVLILGGGLCSGSVNMAMFLIARFVAGLGIGMLVTSIPTHDLCFLCSLDNFVKLTYKLRYQEEVSTPESRGLVNHYSDRQRVRWAPLTLCRWFTCMV